MFEVITPLNPKFEEYKLELKVLYEENQEKIADTNSFEFVIENSFFYAFLNKNSLIGAIYYFVDEDKLFLNAYSKRKNHLNNILCLEWSTTWFSCDIYAEAQNRASAICLLKCGFSRVENNLFCKKKIIC